MNNLEIKVKYLIEKLEPINQAHDGEWYDLRAAEDISLAPGEFKLIPLGVAIQLPEGYEAIMAPRSSTFKRYGILQSNSIGVIDNAYCGDTDQWFFPVFATTQIDISKNDRICQFRIQKIQPYANLVEVESLDNKNRGGLGSTGVN